LPLLDEFHQFVGRYVGNEAVTMGGRKALSKSGSTTDGRFQRFGISENETGRQSVNRIASFSNRDVANVSNGFERSYI
jgi:hypothetical protein